MQERPFPKKTFRRFSFFLVGIILGGIIFLGGGYFAFEKKYAGKVYPGVKILGKDFGGQTHQQVEDYFAQRKSQIPFNFTFTYQEKAATVSAQKLKWGYDEKTLATQAYLSGRSGHFLSDLYQKGQAWYRGADLSPLYSFDDGELTRLLLGLAAEIDIPAQEALFQFENNRVVTFRLSADGLALDIAETKEKFNHLFPVLILNPDPPTNVVIELPVKVVKPKVSTEEANNLGIRELLGRGSSRFGGSILNRIHNITLASSRLNGILVLPGEEFSFNKALGDVSKFTGYKEAYIIKEGRTVLGDGGGVCQVSTTFFRAVLNAGLPTSERHAHSYRVGYYEQDSLPGLDASVYDPLWDLKFRNDTGAYILIQSWVDVPRATLVFEFYGTGDGRQVTITKPVITNQTAPPPDLYQDDPTLPKGQIKQIDWAAWGAQVSFSRTVTRKGEVLVAETFNSSYQPWQAVFLRGTKE